MRRIALLTIYLLILSGCGMYRHERAIYTGFADFRPYTTAGFYISPDPYTGGEHTVIGTLSAHVYPGVDMATYTQESIPSAELLELTVAEAKKRGANGIVDYSVSEVFNSRTGSLDYYEISALLILIHEL